MDQNLILSGMIVGLALAAPVGPISLVCIQRTVAGGRLHGICSGLGVATADSFYAAVAFLGLTAISGFILEYQGLFRLLAGLALIIIGISVFRSLPAAVPAGDRQGSLLRDYVSLLAVTLANPLTIIFYLTILPGFGIGLQGVDPVAGLSFVGGVFLGSSLWWGILCGAVGAVRSRLSAENLRWINKVSGVFILCCGLVILALVLAIP